MSAFVQSAEALDLPWQPWGLAAIMRATELDRPLLILAGCDSDHWSAQWLRELAADDEVCGAVAAACVVTVVGVAEQPALAARIQQLLSVNGAVGWPAMAFALPDGQLVGAIPYAPVRDGSKRAGVLRIALDVATTWRERPADLRADAAQLAQMADFFADGADPRGVPAAGLVLDGVEATVIERADPLQGGFGPPPRFHQPAILRFLAERARNPQSPPAVLDHLTRALDALIAGAVHDHFGGGFFHAAQDAAWRRPFADKRLADNARLIAVLYEASGPCERSVYRAVAAHAIEWVRHALRHDSGWCHAVHADSPAADGSLVEGAFYAWSAGAVAEVIGREAAQVVTDRYLADAGQAIDDEQAWRIPAAHGELDPAQAERLPEWCRRLAVARSERPQPARCESIYQHEQGLWLRALALAVSHTDSSDVEDWRVDGQALAERLVWLSEEVAATDVKALAAIGRGLAAWQVVMAEANGEQASVAGAVAEAAQACGQRLVETASEHGGLMLGIDPVLGAVYDPSDPLDDVAPVAEAAELWLDLFEQTGDRRWMDAVRRLLEAHAGILRVAAAGCVGLSAAWARWQRLGC